jgi:acetolactate synthase I/III small subunit
MAKIKMKRRAILMFVLNRPGVLNKISMLIRRKMYNVETLTTCKTIRPGIHRMILTLREDQDVKMSQVIKQIEKITEVISAKELDMDDSFLREVAVIKVETDDAQMRELEKKYHFEILDRYNHGTMILQVAGTSQHIDDFLNDLGRDRLIEAARSGFTALEK